MLFYPLIMFNHSSFLQSQSLSVLATVSVVFAQYLLRLCGVRSLMVLVEGPFGLWFGPVGQPCILLPCQVKVDYCFSAIPAFLLSPLLLSALMPLATWSSQVCQAVLFRELPVPSPITSSYSEL